MKVATDTTKMAKTIALQAARQVAQEPLEVLKQAREQVIGRKAELTTNRRPKTVVAGEGISPTEEERILRRDSRLIMALEQELKEIQRQKREEQEKAEQQEKLIAEERLIKKKEIPPISTKPSRKLFSFGAKQKAESLKTRVEKPLPPTG